MRSGLALAAILGFMAGCSASEEAGAPPATADEQRALADARSMIPADELPDPTPTETATNDQ